MNIFSAFEENMIDFQIMREGVIVATEKGLPNQEKGTNKKFVGFYPSTDIQTGDIITNPQINIPYYVIDVDFSSFQGEIQSKSAYYSTIKPNNEVSSKVTYNITNATNSIIGNQQNVTQNITFPLNDLKNKIKNFGNSDIERLNFLYEEIENSINSKNIKKGFLSSFNDLLNKYEWLMPTIAQIICTFIVK